MKIRSPAVREKRSQKSHFVSWEYFRLKAAIRTFSLFQDIVRDMNDSRVNICHSAKPTRSIRLLGDCRQVMPAHCSLIHVLFVQVKWWGEGNLAAHQCQTLTHGAPD